MIRRGPVGRGWGRQARSWFVRPGPGRERRRIGWRELARGGRARVERFEARQRRSVVADQELAVEELADLDAAAGVGRAAAAGGDGKAVAVEGDGVVFGDDAFVLEAEDSLRWEAGGPR